MELTIDQALQKATEAHKAGQVQEADRLYTAILKAQPRHPDANHNMGVLAVGVGKVQEALPFFKTALEGNPSTAQFWLNYIDALIKLDRMDDAKAVLDQAKGIGAKGDGFDKLEQQLRGIEPTDSRPSNTQEPPQDQLQSLVDLRSQGQLKQTLDRASQLLHKFPNSAIIYNICGTTHKGLGQLDDAIECYKKAINIRPDYAVAYNNMGNAFQEDGKLEEATEAFNEALAIKPDYAGACYNMGNALKDQGKLEEAIEAYNKALTLKPDYADACYNMGNALKDQGKLEESIKAYNKALAIKPDYAGACYNMGVSLQEQGKLEEATEAYNKALAIKPDYADAYNNMGDTLKEQGKLEEAIEAYNNALAIKPDYAEAHNNMGVAFIDRGKLEEAIDAYNKALSLKPDYAEAYNNLANAFGEQGNLGEAIEAFNKAIAINPNFAIAYNNMGNALKKQDKLEEAIGVYKKAIVINPDYAEVYRNLSSLIKYKPNDPLICTVEKLLKRPDLKDSDRCNFLYTYAKMNEDLGNIEAAYENYVIGGALRRKLLGYKPEQDQKLFKKIKKTAPKLKVIAFNVLNEATAHAPIFILGMPRSGTTLVEQIISCHSKVQGAGELPFVSRLGSLIATQAQPITSNAMVDFRKSYLDELAKVSSGNQFVTDKMPHNFRYIGLILKALPEAKVIHIKRDAAATCWSNFKHYFASTNLGYSYDLGNVVTYFKRYLDLMNFWDKHYGNHIYNLDYDRLTIDQDLETRKLIEYLGLEWEDHCLSPENNKRIVTTASQLQVRKKVYTGSSLAWRKFEPYLKGVFDELGT